MDNPYSIIFLVENLYLSGIWFGVAPRVETKKTYVEMKTRLHAQNMTTISNSIANNIERPVWPFHKDKSLYFGNEENSHMSSTVYEESSYTLDLDSLAISY